MILSSLFFDEEELLSNPSSKILFSCSLDNHVKSFIFFIPLQMLLSVSIFKYISNGEYLLNMSEEILNKKIKMEMRISQTFLKESQELFSIYDDLFKQDFQKEINFKANKSVVHDGVKIKSEDPAKEIKELKEKKDRDPELYKIYKKIARKIIN